MSNFIPSELTGPQSRRKLLTRAGLFGAGVVGAGLLGKSPVAKGAVAAFGARGHRFEVRDQDIANFALNLEYLEAEYYLLATTGAGLSDADSSGVGTQGAVTGGRQVTFTDPVITALAKTLATDELNHVRLLREVLGERAVARPAIDLTTSFNTAYAAATSTPGATFDPFASELNFLIGAFVFEDVGVTAYHGAAPYIQHDNILSPSAGILGIEAYHAGAIRTLLANAAQTDPTIYTQANAISALREAASAAADGVAPTETPLLDTTTNTPNLDAADANSVAFARSFAAVLNIVYLGATSAPYGFFPNKLNGRIA